MPLISNTKNWYAMSDPAIVKEIGSLIKLIRLQKNITQQQLADTVGLYRSTISEMENGRASSLLSFIQVLRGLNMLELFNSFTDVPPVSPLKLAKEEGLIRRKASVKKIKEPESPEESTW